MSASELSIDDLGPYLEKEVDGFRGLRTIDKFAGGQSNPTYLLTASSGQYVLRRKPFGELLKSAHAVEREYRVMQALEDTAVPVPRMLHLCEDPDVIGAVFFVMSFVKARHFWDPALPELDDADRTAIFDEMNRVLAALHSVDVEMIGLADFGYPGNYFERQISRWSKQYRASETKVIAAMDELLDWELSTLGHPFADLAYQCMQLRMPQDCVIRGLGGVDRAPLGIPSEAAFVADYCGRSGLDEIPNWTFYLVFSFFRFAAILQGVLKRAIDGNASSDQAFAYGALTAPLAEMAIEELQ